VPVYSVSSRCAAGYPAVVITVSSTPVHAPESVALVREYFAELVARWHGRPATGAEVDEAMVDEPSDDLAPPHNAFLVARDGDSPIGCAGVRRLDPVVAELTRVFVRPAARGSGVARRLLAEAEAVAGEWGVAAIRLDTRHDLVEARALYASGGYVEIPAYNDSRYASHWFEKKLPTAVS
jgi:GNAT superfamily N-acetyltransferase